MRRGCLISLVVVACLPLALCGAYKYFVPRSRLPAKLEISEVIEYDEDFGMREGCTYGVYRLTSTGSSNVANAGLPYETPIRFHIRGTDYHILPNGRTLYALGADGGCGQLRSDAPSVRPSLNEPGNRFKVFNGGEGLIVADPKRRLAWYLYFG